MRGGGFETLALELEDCVPAAPSAEAVWEAREIAAVLDRWLERLEYDLDTILREITAELRREIFPEEAPAADFELCYRAFLEHLVAHGLLSDDPADRYGTGWLEDVASDTWSVDRVCWLAAEVTVPAGGSVSLTASMAKAGSYDFYCADRGNRGLYGYDLVTTLGSCLPCTEQQATLEDRGFIEIVRQNFGFDLDAGVKTGCVKSYAQISLQAPENSVSRRRRCPG